MSQLHDGQRLPVPQDAPWVRVLARRDGPRVDLVVQGDADTHTCGQLRAELISALDGDVNEVRVDLSGLSFCDLAGSDALHDFTDEAAVLAITVDLDGMSPLLSFLYSSLPPRRADRADRVLLHAVADTAGLDFPRGDPALTYRVEDGTSSAVGRG